MLLAERQGFVHLSTGDVFRDAVAQGTQLGLEADDYIRRGHFVPDAMVIALVKARLVQEDAIRYGFSLNKKKLDWTKKHFHSPFFLSFFLFSFIRPQSRHHIGRLPQDRGSGQSSLCSRRPGRSSSNDAGS